MLKSLLQLFKNPNQLIDCQTQVATSKDEMKALTIEEMKDKSFDKTNFKFNELDTKKYKEYTLELAESFKIPFHNLYLAWLGATGKGDREYNEA